MSILRHLAVDDDRCGSCNGAGYTQESGTSGAHGDPTPCLLCHDGEMYRETEARKAAEQRAERAEAEREKMRAAIERTLRFMASDPHADIDWNGDISGLLMSYAAGLDNMRETFAAQRDEAIAAKEKADARVAELEGMTKEAEAICAAHHCMVCGWAPIEGLPRYREIHGTEAECMRCKASLVVGAERPDARGECKRCGGTGLVEVEGETGRGGAAEFTKCYDCADDKNSEHA